MTRESIQKDIQSALDTLRSGGIILYPTDTIWGIGCAADNEEAVKRIFQLKKRHDGKAMISLVGSLPQLESYVESIPEEALKEIKAAASPLTVIFPAPKNIAPSLLASDGSAGFRICGFELIAELCLKLGKPIVSTSANISSEPAPSSFEEISVDIREGVDYIMNIGHDIRGNAPSAIIKFTSGGEKIRIR